MSVTEHERWGDDVAAYLLGALDEDERDAFERHLETCHVCQDECARLEPAAEALPRSVEQYDPPPGLKLALMERVQADVAPARRPRPSFAERFSFVRPQVAVGLAAAALAIGVAVGIGLSGGGNEGARTVAASVDQARIGEAKAELVVPGDDHDAHLNVSAMPQTRPGQVYEVWLKRGDRIEPGPLFGVDRNGNGAAAVPGDLDGVDQVMVTRERAGGARQPTEMPVISVDVS
jgi:anti-sigma-K factor RskA